MKEMSPMEYQAIKKFSKGLKECFSNKSSQEKNEIVKLILNYVVEIIELHLQIAELEVEYSLTKLEKTLDKK